MKRIALALLSLLLLFSGCEKKPAGVTDRSSWSEITNEEQEKFNEFQKQFFIDACADDYTTMRFYMHDPASYGITDYEVSWGQIEDPEAVDKSVELQKQLHEFDYEKLNKDQQIVYDTLEFEFNTSIPLTEKSKEFDFAFSPNSGFNNGVITNLTEMNLETEKDVKEFIELLMDTDRIFDDCIEYTRKQAARGYVQADVVIDGIIEQIDRFMSAENNEIIVSFNDEVAELSFDCTEYKQQVETIVKNEVIPAYQKVKDMYLGLKGKCTTNGVLADYDGGKEYYQLMVQNSVGTDETMDEIADELYEAIADSLNSLISVQSKMKEESGFAPADVYELMDELKKRSASDVPALKELTYTIDYLNPTVTSENVAAYFMGPPYDDQSKNVIKVNPTFVTNDPDGLASTLAHEGYPGHMYAHSYFDQYHPNSEIKRIVSYLGYGEGWAQYAGLRSYDYFCTDKYFIEYSKSWETFTYATYAYTDIMMHYNGWTEQDVIDFYAQFFSESAAANIGSSIFTSNCGDPGMFIPYSWGMIKMVDYHETAKEELGKKYSELELNKLILDVGEVPMFILDKEVEQFIADNK